MSDLYPSTPEIPSNSPQSGAAPWYQPAAAELAPAAASVWPPPPPGAAYNAGLAAVTLPIRVTYRRVANANISDLREGQLLLTEAGIGVQGKSIPRAEIKTPLCTLGFIFGRVIGAVIIWAILRYGFPQPTSFMVSWSDVIEVILNSPANQAGFAYTGPNYRGKLMKFSLTAKLTPAEFATFSEYALRYAPDRTREGRIPTATTLFTWIILGVIIALFAFGIFYSIQHR